MKKNDSFKVSGAEMLITGGAGFIGSNLAKELVKRGAKVTVLDAMISPYGGNKFNLKDIRKKITFVEGDIRSSRTIRRLVSGKDFIFHLAGQTGRTISMNKPKFDLSINCHGTLSILEAIKREKNKAKLVFSSSRGVVGQPVYLPVDENHPTKPRDIYGANKLAAENYCLTYGREYNFGSTVLRFNNIYGPKCQIRSSHYGTINLFISYALQGKVLPIFGDGKQTRDYLHVKDAVAALIYAIESKANGEFFFVGTGKPSSLLKIAKLIKSSIKSSKHTIVSYPEDLKGLDFPHFYSTSKKIENILGWKYKIELKEGIADTIKYYKKYMKQYI